ncbi:MAG TPA: BolA/IbaG family iron-sulfur metabolism protein [Gallionellaceae bacterium]|nr:BolA/IbaG family iron-sulfur metabolism protein [Gallionellaceae bacterium]
MVTPESIKKDIEQGMSTSYLTVVGDGQHFEAVIVSEEFAGLSRIQRQQRVNKTLGNRMTTDIHALSMKTFTPQEWQEKQ